MNPRVGRDPANHSEEEDDTDIDWNKVKYISVHGVIEPLVSGIFFAVGWLGTFYLLKKKFNV